MGYEATRETIMAYTRGGTESYGHDRTQLAEDAVFTLMSTGKAFQGRAEVEKLLDLFYGQAFEGRDEIQTIIVEETHAVVEALFMAKHIGEFDGVAPTGKQAQVPYCAVYTVEGNKVRAGHLYLDVDMLRNQLTSEKEHKLAPARRVVE